MRKLTILILGLAASAAFSGCSRQEPGTLQAVTEADGVDHDLH